MTRTLINTGIAAALALLFGACGGDSSPTSPGSGGGGGTGGTVAATITITAAGVSPKEVTVAAGSRVMFVNNDNRSHDMASDPHPTHENCPPINDLGVIAAGQSKTTGNLNTVRTCGFHDHNLPENTSLQGTIRVQ